MDRQVLQGPQTKEGILVDGRYLEGVFLDNNLGRNNNICISSGGRDQCSNLSACYDDISHAIQRNLFCYTLIYFIKHLPSLSILV